MWKPIYSSSWPEIRQKKIFTNQRISSMLLRVSSESGLFQTAILENKLLRLFMVIHNFYENSGTTKNQPSIYKNSYRLLDTLQPCLKKQ